MMNPKYGFIDKNGNVFLQYCPKCGRENYLMNVPSGVCSWCGYNDNEDESIKDENDEV